MAVIFRPSRTGKNSEHFYPSDESLGYFWTSLRDQRRSHRKQICRNLIIKLDSGQGVGYVPGRSLPRTRREQRRSRHADMKNARTTVKRRQAPAQSSAYDAGFGFSGSTFRVAKMNHENLIPIPLSVFNPCSIRGYAKIWATAKSAPFCGCPWGGDHRPPLQQNPDQKRSDLIEVNLT